MRDAQESRRLERVKTPLLGMATAHGYTMAATDDTNNLEDNNDTPQLKKPP